MNRTDQVAFFMATALLFCLESRAQVIVPWALRGTIDTDGDSSPNLVDNAPGVANNQADGDGDQIGDVIDPTPLISNPVLGTLVVGIPPVPSILAGSSAVIPYTPFNSPPTLVIPPGDYGYIDLDLGGDSVFDATYFGPLSAAIDQIVIPPSLFTSPLWNLNTPGTYTFHAMAFAPGVSVSGVGVSISSVEVLPVPEPAGVAMLAAGVAVAVPRLRRR
ncbi:MAG: hypothetical protein ACRCT8_12470 [Lacipirellulaceae bacterium]